MIKLTDNNKGQYPAESFSRDTIASLFPLSDKPISQLCKENENLLLFPYCLDESNDEIEDSCIFSIKNTDTPNLVTIETSNLMGFIGVGDLRIKIGSRFDNGEEDYFLHYMLQQVMHINLFDLKHNKDNEDALDFSVFMFPLFLKRAMRQGFYREYKRNEHNDSKVKGTISIGRHLQRNMPFAGKVAYSTKEYSYDNGMTKLVRHTVEYIRTKRYGKSVLNKDKETIRNVSEIIAQTPSYSQSQRKSIIQQNLRKKVHPYYTEYSPLRILCLQILKNDYIKYGEQEDMIFGVLFDGAWLWEEYINTVLAQEGFTHPENKRSLGAIHLFKDIKDDGRLHISGKRYPDFYKEGIVLDAKYKRLENYDKVSKIDRNDIHQIITYMEALEANVGGFVAPLTESNKTPPTSHFSWAPESTISIFGIEVASSHSFESFANQMHINEKEFLMSIHHIANKNSDHL